MKLRLKIIYLLLFLEEEEEEYVEEEVELEEPEDDDEEEEEEQQQQQQKRKKRDLTLTRSKCKDLSDAVYPAENDACEKQFMKYCKNNQTCIHENLFCDGHEQCEDGSDEDQEFCQHCPR